MEVGKMMNFELFKRLISRGIEDDMVKFLNIVLLTGIVLLFGCSGEGPNYSFTLSVTNNTDFNLFISVTTEIATHDLGWSPANRMFNFGLVEVYVPEDKPNPECLLMAKKEQHSQVAYANKTVALEGTLHVDWIID